MLCTAEVDPACAEAVMLSVLRIHLERRTAATQEHVVLVSLVNVRVAFNGQSSSPPPVG